MKPNNYKQTETMDSILLQTRAYKHVIPEISDMPIRWLSSVSWVDLRTYDSLVWLYRWDSLCLYRIVVSLLNEC